MIVQALAMFPGQGSQYVGMGQKLLAEFPYTRAIFEEAEDHSHLSIRKLCFDGPEDELKLTANTQPCLLTVSVAYWTVLRHEVGFQPALFAGHSLGEYSALVAAGKLDLGRAAYLVRKRGEFMQEAVPYGIGAMAAVLKMETADLEALCERLSSPQARVEVANYNSDGQLVVAGHKEMVKKLCDELKTRGIRCVDLPVSAPFHSSLMRPAREAMTPLLRESSFRANEAQIIVNLTGKVVSAYQSDLLEQQIDGPVRWLQSMETALQRGITSFIEVGPGKVLHGLVRRMVPKDTHSVLASDEIEAILPILTH